jgi:hypothetical protein
MLNTAIGNVNVSNDTKHTQNFNQALLEQYTNQFTLNDLLEYVGFELTTEVDDATIDLSLNNLERDTFVKLFE